VGTKVCQGGSIVCKQNVQASTEVCDNLDNNCNGAVDEGNPGGGAACSTGKLGVCAAGTTTCTAGVVSCVQNVQPSTEVCDGKDNNCDGTVDEGNPGGGAACTTGVGGTCDPGTMKCVNGALACKATAAVAETCNNKDDDCDGVIDNGVSVTLLNETFANNAAGWTLGTEWQIGAATAGSMPGTGYADPATDHTPTADNGVAGVVIGGSYSVAATHGSYYLTSPIINSTGTGAVTLDFWRWLNSDYPTYAINTVEVYNGSSWVAVWTQPSDATFITDSAWTRLYYDLTTYKNANMRVRFGFSVGSTSAISMTGWNLDDVVVRRCQ
jgi:hypothetical protein